MIRERQLKGEVMGERLNSSGSNPEVRAKPETGLPSLQTAQRATDEYWRTQFVDLAEEDARPLDETRLNEIEAATLNEGEKE